MKENEKEPKFKKLNRDDFLYEINQLFQEYASEENRAKTALKITEGMVDSVNDMLQFVTASEEQGLRVVYFKDEETGDLRVDTLPKRPWNGLLK